MSATHETATPVISDSVRRLWRRVLGKEAESPAAPAPLTGPVFRRSNGLAEFWRGLEPQSGLRILDLGSASQANVNFITGRGFKLYTEDLFRALWLPSRRPPASARPAARERPLAGPKIEPEETEEDRFFRENLNHAEGAFDGILCWDLLDLLADPLVKPLIERLHHILKPGGSLLTFFHTGRPGDPVPLLQYRIGSEDTLQMIPQGAGNLRRYCNNRSIENLFRRFASLKFFLSRDNLREVVIAR